MVANLYDFDPEKTSARIGTVTATGIDQKVRRAQRLNRLSDQTSIFMLINKIHDFLGVQSYRHCFVYDNIT